MISLILNWLGAKWWIVAAIAIVATFSFWEGRHSMWLEWQADESRKKTEIIGAYHDNETIRNGVARVPDGDAWRMLVGEW